MKLLRDYLFIFGGIGIVVALSFNNIILPLYVNWNNEIRVPSLTHTDLNKATKILKERTLEWTIKDTIFRRDIPSGFIMDQYPEAGQMVKENRKIQLTINLPPAKLEMPDLIAITERQATIALDRLGLVLVETLTDSSDQFERTVVMEQSVLAGMPVAPGDSITITVSLGKRNLKKSMPDLLNKGLDEARRTLESQGFLLGEVQTTENSDLLPNTVVSQSVAAGKEFPRERIIQVDLMITDGF
ncbi:MAG: PASTA domain-containing protein [Candidatus Marinimicrobia bacterium]|jgi:serine/threonine-protein kinase|nr:PASTA domain-containing protein [Candidatus Neomarinimicrobiota bacterium]MBT3576654.1 PASTA domain-containing protein [Candidatus Neomarinimicrobiota bacterium]MBT3678910.1 PASTA domain-containing protein [Candidatus Neomarinimicrobiota bacterium]MBT3952257.1 PASTA domain-containing protein [Candidatus Neomarinimicrobiota bacterium]MBT4252918.1 PASTA domain-containing protein [Candidatus Neomarinimicrobiota bacterium]